MRKLCLVLGVLLVPLSAGAQQSWTLPPIGLPPPRPNPALKSDWGHRAPWVQAPAPLWDKGVPWDRRPGDTPRGDVNGRRGHRGNTQVVYYVPYAAGYYPEPQVIVVQQPPVERIVEVRVPAPEPRAEAPPAVEQPPPYVPTGDRTVYVIPGCYVGNVSPVNLKLAANCDITKLTTYVP
jgi:hypothetical protein